MTGKDPLDNPRPWIEQTERAGSSKKGDGGGGGGDRPASCNIHFQATLASPNPALVSKLGASTVLQVDIAQTTLRGKTVSSLVAKLGSQIAGSIDDIKSADVIACIGKGFRYKATVLRATGGDILVSVSKA
jgi:hypothetical protein